MMGSRRAIVYLLVVFLLGFACGGLVTYWTEKAGWWDAHTHKRHKPLQWLTQELDLTPEQQEKLKPILDKTGERYYEIFSQVHSEFEEVRQATREKIRALLTPEQREKFEKLVQKIEEREAKIRRKYAPEAGEEKSGGEQESSEE